MRRSTLVGELFVEASGEGPVVLAWPSLFMDGTCFASVRALVPDVRWLMVDPPGHGRSGRAHPGLTLERCAVAMAEVLDAEGVRDAFVLGVAFGGMVGLRLALQSPERVRGLLLTGSSGDAGRGFVARLRSRFVSGALGRLPLAGPLENGLVDTLFARASRQRSPSLEADFRRRVRAADLRAMAEVVPAVLLDRTSVLASAASIEVPVQLMVGDDDRAIDPAETDKLAVAIPRARVTRVPQAGHSLPLEAPAAVAAALRALVREA